MRLAETDSAAGVRSRVTHKRQEKGGANPFVDPAGYRSYIAEREHAFLDELAKQQKEAAGTAPKR